MATPGIIKGKKIETALKVRERLILKLVTKGCTNKQIANRLFISIETVRKHLKNSYKKLEAHNKIEALRKAGLL